jgi:uncharacterized circularly permuted ATP-grasp superfamily protein
VHVIYRRIDEAFLDPEVFRPDSLLGVPGLLRAYKAGKVALANALGNGVADDKAVYPFVPDIIRHYLQRGADPRAGAHVRLRARRRSALRAVEHLDELVVKAVDEAGGYGMLMGPRPRTAEERDEFRRRIEADPASYIAQPRSSSRRARRGTRRPSRSSPRRVDLRPYVLTSPERAVGAAGRAHARRAARGLVHRQLEPRRRLQGHLGVRNHD